MEPLAVVLLVIVWFLCVIAAVGIGHMVSEARWRKRAKMRSFDALVREYRDTSEVNDWQMKRI
jgi:hypothetical protein